MAIIGFSVIMMYIFIGVRDNWSLQVILIVIIAMGFGLIFLIRNIEIPIYCKKCQRDVASVFKDSELKSYEVLFCPYCGESINNENT